MSLNDQQHGAIPAYENMRRVHVALGSRAYDVHLAGLLASAPKL